MRRYQKYKSRLISNKVYLMQKYVYLGGPINGLEWEEATNWRDYVAEKLDPIYAISPLRLEDGLIPFGPDGPGRLPFKERFRRDYSDVMKVNGLFFNLLGAKTKSIGTTCEIAWSYYRQAPVALVIRENDVNYDKFLLQCVKMNPRHIITPDIDTAIKWTRNIFGVPDEHPSKGSER